MSTGINEFRSGYETSQTFSEMTSVVFLTLLFIEVAKGFSGSWVWDEDAEGGPALKRKHLIFSTCMTSLKWLWKSYKDTFSKI